MPVGTVGAAAGRVGGSTVTGAMAVAGGSAIVLLAGLGGPAWSLDEAATVMVIDRPIAQVWRTWLTDPALEPYYLLINAWSQISTADWWLRLPSVLAAAATAGLVVLIVSHFLSLGTAIASGVLFALLPAVTRYGQEARPYALVMLVTTAVVWCWLRNRSLPGPRRVLLAAGLVMVGLLHAYALIVLPVLVAVTLLRPETDRRRELTGLLVAGGAAVLALSPFLVLLSQRASGDPSPAAITPVNLVVEAIRLPVAVLRPWGAPLTGGLVLALMATGVVLGWRRAGELRTLVLLAVVWLGGWILCLVALQLVTGAPGLVARYWVPALPALAIGIAPLLEAMRRRSTIVVAALLVLVAAVGLPTQLALRGPDGHSGQGWTRLAGLLDQPSLASLPVLAKGSSARRLLANGVDLSRMPLVTDPAPEGRVLARADATAAAVRELAQQQPIALVLANADDQLTAPPDREAFPNFRRELSVYSRAVVLCSYYGEPVGVFARPDVTIQPTFSAGIVAALAEPSTDRARCLIPDGG